MSRIYVGHLISGLLGVLLCAAMLLASPPVALAGVTVALTPSPATVAPGGDFELDVTVTQAGSSFNGFDAYVGYDPLALTFLGYSPVSSQQGSLFLNACSNTFHDFKVRTDTLDISLVMLCSGVSVTGPGQLYRLHFQASSQPQFTHVRFLPGLQFYNAGLYVNPASSTDATVQIGNPTAVDGEATSFHLTLQASPNPCRRGTVLRVETPGNESGSLIILDPLGRVVRHLRTGRFGAGKHALPWDGRSDAGDRLASGVYTATLTMGGHAATIRVALLR